MYDMQSDNLVEILLPVTPLDQTRHCDVNLLQSGNEPEEVLRRNMPPRRAASRRVAEVTRAAAGRPRASNQTASQRQPGGFESATAGGEESATALAAVLAELRRLGERQETCQVAIVSLQKDNQRLQEAVSGDREAIASTSGSMTTGTSNSTLSGSVANLVNTITGTEYGEPSRGLILVE
ncbi:uncharacterized protein [Littorina saxatilis]|uniref:uncharacterized protein isoform X2 n=1 Tax=Littorina saxatilis TaxID=31220 RepID=UPI0038B65393